MVQRALQENAKTSSTELLARALAMVPDLGLTVQQFHARYVLPVLRAAAARRKRSGSTKVKKAISSRPRAVPMRERVLNAMMALSTQLIQATGLPEQLRIITTLDTYVDMV